MNRALKFVADSYGGVIPNIELTDDDVVLFAQITSELQGYIDKVEKVGRQLLSVCVMIKDASTVV